MEVRPLTGPGESVADPLDQKIQAAMGRSPSAVNPFAASKMTAVPQLDGTEE
jgi:hypothetical protein